jgi:carboxyl-terminal processing protease
MSKIRNSVLLLALCWMICLSADGRDDQDNISQLIDKTISSMDKGTVQDVWAVCTELEKYARRGKEGAIEQIITATRKGSELTRLGCAKTLLELFEEREAIPILLELGASGKDRAIRLSAISILGTTTNYLEERLTDRVEEFLDGILEEETDTELLMETAKALFRVSSTAYRTKARNVLKQMYDSDIQEIRINAALALAEIGELDISRKTLKEIQDDPSYQGRMAKIILKAREMERYLSSKLYDKTMGMDGENNLRTSNAELDLIAEIVNIIQDKHIRGDQFTSKDGVENLLTAAAKGMLNYLDPHSTYFSQKEHERWLLDLERKYAGIGAYVDTVDGVFTIIRPIYSGPAYREGLRSGDQIWKVDGWETFSQPNEEIIRRLKGLPDSEVTVTIFRSGWKDARDFRIAREQINIPSVNAELLPGGIGYVEVTQFAAKTGVELEKKLEMLADRGAEGLILDLRNNTGGYLSEAVHMCSVFLPVNNLVVYTEGRVKKGKQEYSTSRAEYQWKQPVIVLVNRRSASASEIVAGALQHYRRAIVLGEKTYGKGSVQNPMVLESRFPEDFIDENRNGIYDQGEDFRDRNNNGRFDIGSMLKVTTAMYYLPSGRSIHTLRNGEGGVINDGGVNPEKAVKYEGLESWKEEELADLVEKEVFKKYVDEHYNENRQLFVQLAEGDDFDWNRYPDFASFYNSLGTHLSKNDFRKMIRVELRARVPDDRRPARPFPGFGFYGDYQEDSQLQASILTMLEKINRNPRDILAYRNFVDKKFEKPRSAMKDEKVAKKEQPGGEKKEKEN